tara:strand:- start:403 stop:1110 length:708 start_codon:yes stop_codon:yes gene_type:complete
MESKDQFDKSTDESTDELFTVSETELKSNNPDNELLYPSAAEEDTSGKQLDPLTKGKALYPTKPVMKPAPINRPQATDQAARDQRNRSKPRKGQPTNYYHPNDYYLGTDWPRLIIGTLASLILLVAIGFLALFLFDSFDNESQTNQIVSSPNSEITIIDAFACAGDNQIKKQISSLPSALLSGKNAAGTWVAFQDPDSPSTQLWARASDLPYDDLTNLEIVSCENSSETEIVTDS